MTCLLLMLKWLLETTSRRSTSGLSSTGKKSEELKRLLPTR
jgi:hypothetical protein